jgi:DNA-binding NarL/FixJ family response regulator
VKLRIVVADDHSVVREGLRALLSAVEGYELVGTGATGGEAVKAAVTLHPDVLVMDIQMPDMTGIGRLGNPSGCLRLPC